MHTQVYMHISQMSCVRMVQRQSFLMRNQETHAHAQEHTHAYVYARTQTTDKHRHDTRAHVQHKTKTDRLTDTHYLPYVFGVSLQLVGKGDVCACVCICVSECLCLGVRIVSSVVQYLRLWTALRICTHQLCKHQHCTHTKITNGQTQRDTRARARTYIYTQT